jgi:pyruvate/2-oxoglutarate/acetoin dehydrogenase E1 component
MVPATATRNISYIQAINETLRQEMQSDPTVIVMGEDVAGGAGREDQGIIDSWGGPMRLTKGLIREFGAARVRDTPISEAGFIGAGIGAAATGLRPAFRDPLLDLHSFPWP